MLCYFNRASFTTKLQFVTTRSALLRQRHSHLTLRTYYLLHRTHSKHKKDYQLWCRTMPRTNVHNRFTACPLWNTMKTWTKQNIAYAPNPEVDQSNIIKPQYTTQRSSAISLWVSDRQNNPQTRETHDAFPSVVSEQESVKKVCLHWPA